MKILDRYVLLQFIKNFLFGIFCFILIFILVDLFENIDKFIDKNLTSGHIFQYYIYFIPEIIKLITPVSLLLATLFTVSKFTNYSEMTAINSSGISLFRFSVPLIIFGILCSLFSIWFNGWIVPKSNSQKFNFERRYMDKNRLSGLIQNLHVQDSENHIISIGTYNESDKTALTTSVQIFDDKNLSKLDYRFDAKIMKWDSIKNEWKLINVSKREFDSSSMEKFSTIDSIYVSEIPEISKIFLSPPQILKKQLKPDELTISEQKELINSLEESGQDVSRTRVDYYSKISFPFANIIILFFGLSLGSNKRKSGAALQFGTCILFAFIYLGFTKVSQTLGYNGEIDPMLTAWLANILFLFLAAINLIRINIFWK